MQAIYVRNHARLRPISGEVTEKLHLLEQSVQFGCIREAGVAPLHALRAAPAEHRDEASIAVAVCKNLSIDPE
jgi:hypothetical protein